MRKCLIALSVRKALRDVTQWKQNCNRTSSVKQSNKLGKKRNLLNRNSAN